MKEKANFKIDDLSLEELIRYKKCADMLYDQYDNLAKANIGAYDSFTNSEYDNAMIKTKLFADIRAKIMNEIEKRVSSLSC